MRLLLLFLKTKRASREGRSELAREPYFGEAAICAGHAAA